MAVRVRAALDAAAATTAAAGVLGPYDLKAAAALLDRADAIRRTGSADGPSAGLPSREESVKEWERMHGGSWSDPAVREKVYSALAAERRMEREAADKAAAARLKGAAGAAKLRKRYRRK